MNHSPRRTLPSGRPAEDDAGWRHSLGLRDSDDRNPQRQRSAGGWRGLWSDRYGLGQAGRPDWASLQQVKRAAWLRLPDAPPPAKKGHSNKLTLMEMTMAEENVFIKKADRGP
jgi:hypothetical protein